VNRNIWKGGNRFRQRRGKQGRKRENVCRKREFSGERVQRRGKTLPRDRLSINGMQTDPHDIDPLLYTQRQVRGNADRDGEREGAREINRTRWSESWCEAWGEPRTPRQSQAWRSFSDPPPPFPSPSLPLAPYSHAPVAVSAPARLPQPLPSAPPQPLPSAPPQLSPPPLFASPPPLFASEGRDAHHGVEWLLVTES